MNLTECRMETTTLKHQGILGKKQTETTSNKKKWQWSHGSVGFDVNMSYTLIVNKNVL
jgi:hypothetical protein